MCTYHGWFPKFFPVSDTTLVAQVLQRLQVLQVEDHQHYTYPGLRRGERSGEQLGQTPSIPKHVEHVNILQIPIHIYIYIYTHVHIPIYIYIYTSKQIQHRQQLKSNFIDVYYKFHKTIPVRLGRLQVGKPFHDHLDVNGGRHVTPEQGPTLHTG